MLNCISNISTLAGDHDLGLGDHKLIGEGLSRFAFSVLYFDQLMFVDTQCSCRLQLNRDRKEFGGLAASASTCDDSEGDHMVYLTSSQSSSAQRAWSNICAPRRVQRRNKPTAYRNSSISIDGFPLCSPLILEGFELQQKKPCWANEPFRYL
jgi:hypothetical protein